jgi:hypothetical protein
VFTPPPCYPTAVTVVGGKKAVWRESKGCMVTVDPCLSEGVHRISFRFSNLTRGKWTPLVGFAEEPNVTPLKIPFGTNATSFAYYASGSCRHGVEPLPCNDKWKAGDIIAVEVNCEEQLLFFFVNGRRQPLVVLGIPAALRVGVCPHFPCSLSFSPLPLLFFLLLLLLFLIFFPFLLFLPLFTLSFSVSIPHVFFQIGLSAAGEECELLGVESVPAPSRLIPRFDYKLQYRNFKPRPAVGFAPTGHAEVVVSGTRVNWQASKKTMVLVDKVFTQGTWFAEFRLRNGTDDGFQWKPLIGLLATTREQPLDSAVGNDTQSVGFYNSGTVFQNRAALIQTGHAWGPDALVGMEVDMSARTLKFCVNRVPLLQLILNVPPSVKIGVCLLLGLLPASLPPSLPFSLFLSSPFPPAGWPECTGLLR